MEKISEKSVFSYGLDVEFILRDKKTHLPVSAIDKIEGTKIHPLKVPGGALQADGVLAEINIHPAYSHFDWMKNVSMVLKSLKSIADRYNCYIDFNTIETEFPDKELEDYRAWESGCEPDYNMFTGQENPTVVFDNKIRTCGGHIHIGNPIFRKDHKIAKNLLYHFNFFLSLLMKKEEPPNTRREIYGKWGSYRPKPYGVELRFPSNYWCKNFYYISYMFIYLKQIETKIFEGVSVKEKELIYNPNNLINLLYNKSYKFDDLKYFSFNNYLKRMKISLSEIPVDSINLGSGN